MRLTARGTSLKIGRIPASHSSPVRSATIVDSSHGRQFSGLAPFNRRRDGARALVNGALLQLRLTT